MQSVPFGRFDYVENTAMLKHDIIINYDKNSNFCYTLLVNIDFPESVQKVHEDLLITKQRAELRNDFEKKAINGKTIQNNRNQRDIRLEKKRNRLFNKL